MRPNKFFTLLAVTILHVYAFSQPSTNVIDSLSGHIIKNIRNDNKERIILQTDRKVYAAGEKIWFNAFLAHKINNRLDTASKNLFVDLVNDKDSVVIRAVLNAAEFNTNGALIISDTVSSGYYWLRSYTKKMLRENINDIYVHPVFIINKNKNSTYNPYNRASSNNGQIKAANRPVIEFYPEGGSLVTGINSTVVIQASDAKGDPLSVSGYVMNESDSIVANFATNKFGLSRVSFYPEWDHSYTAVIQHNGTLKYPLPAFNPFAGQVAVTNQNEEWINAVITLEDSIYSKTKATYLLGVSGDSVCFAAVGKGMYNASIPVNSFPGA